MPVFGSQTIQFGDAENSVSLIHQDGNSITVTLEIGEVNLNPVSTKEGQFILMTVDGFARSHNIGQPNLPMVNRVLSIPYGCQLQAEVINYDVEEFSLADYGFSEPLMPSQPSLSKSDDPDFVEFKYDRDSYEKAGYYSLPLTRTKVLGILRSHRLGVISIAPFEYDPINNNIRVYTNLTVRIDYTNPDWATTEEIQRRMYSPYFEAVYDQFFNYNNNYPVTLDDLVDYPVLYVIISDRMFEDQLQRFIDWKTEKGFTVITAYTDEIGYNNTAIRTYIQNLFDTEDPPPSFVLLVGDDQQIPAFDFGAHISDLNFCEFTGDHMPEIYYGRWSAQNPEQLQPQIDKTLEYEMYTMPDPTYLGEVTLVAGVDASHAPTWGNGQINYGTDYYFNVAHGINPNVWLYPRSDEPGAGPAIRETINEGIGLVNYSAHCGHDGWSDPSFTSNDIRNLTNDHKYLLSIGNCCQSNTFGSDYGSPCFGETWLQEPDKGGFGHIGGTDYTYWDEDYWWGVGAGPVLAHPTYEQTGMGAYDGLFHDHGELENEHYITNDALIFCGNLAVVEGGGMSDYYWEIYNLMGDPSIISYMGVPTANNIVHNPTVLLTAQSFTVQADPGSYVGISMDGVLHGQAYVDRSGTVDVPLEPFPQPGTADIVITSQNRVPYISTITVITPEGPYVVFDEFDVNDESGNNDGRVDFGENILLGMQLVNVGPDPAVDVHGTISSDDEMVTITDASETFGDIDGDFGTVNIADAFAFDVSDQAEDGHTIMFDLTTTDDNSNEWTSRFSIPVHAPELNFGDVTFDDSQGNGDGIIDPDETIDIVVSLANGGSAIAGNVTATLSEDDEYVSITDADGSFGDINPDANADNSGDVFTIHTEGNFPAGHSMLFDLNVEADGGYSMAMQFTLRAVESFEYNDGGWVGSGVWEWGAPASGPGAAYDGDNVWATVLGGEYPDGADDALFTTYYTITNSTASLSFYHWYSMESTYDGGNVKITTDGGSTWQLLIPDSGYPEPDVTGLNGEAGFSGESGGWQEVNFDLGAYEGESVKFGFRFGSDGSITGDGWYLDAVVFTGAMSWGTSDPSVTCSPTSFSAVLDSGDVETYALTVGNEGEGMLEFMAAAITDDRFLSLDSGNSSPGNQPDERYIKKRKENGLTYYDYVGPKQGVQPSGDGGIITDMGGPDAFGYIWKDSNEPDGPRYNWIDIQGIGTPITGLGDDSNVGPFDIGFEFPFYDNAFTTFRFCTNGYVSFTSSSAIYDNASLPNSSGPYNLVAPFWDDLDYSSGGQAYYYSSGDSLVISYIDVPHYGYTPPIGPYTFQIILLADGDIIYQYSDLNDPLNSNTVGIQNGDGTIGLQVSYNTDYLTADLAILIKRPLFWLTVAPNAGLVIPGESVDLDVTIDASEMPPGLYTGNIMVNSNDPEHSAMLMPCTLQVITTAIDDNYDTPVPSHIALQQNYPNPFNPVTEVAFSIPTSGHVTLLIFDVMGRCVRTLVDAEMRAGYHSLIWDGVNDTGQPVSSGIYFYKLTQGNNIITKKMTVLK